MKTKMGKFNKLKFFHVPNHFVSYCKNKNVTKLIIQNVRHKKKAINILTAQLKTFSCVVFFFCY